MSYHEEWVAANRVHRDKAYLWLIRMFVALGAVWVSFFVVTVFGKDFWPLEAVATLVFIFCVVKTEIALRAWKRFLKS